MTINPDEVTMSIKRKIHAYEGKEITVQYDVKRCIHASECSRGLRAVFDPKKRPWVQPDNADANAVAGVIHRCPTGALHYDRTDGGAPEPVPPTNTITLDPDGPLLVRGNIKIVTPDGDTVLEDTRVALCRCGLSRNKPLCDNSHIDQFEHDGMLGKSGVKTGDAAAETGAPSQPGAPAPLLTVKPSHNGPLLLSGPLTVVGADKEERTGIGTALCRCGHSSNKPFCDGTHKKVGFVSDQANP